MTKHTPSQIHDPVKPTSGIIMAALISAACIGALAGVIIGAEMGNKEGAASVRHEAIQANAAHYDPHTGAFAWGDAGIYLGEPKQDALESYGKSAIPTPLAPTSAPLPPVHITPKHKPRHD
jgi:hypothetical protein